MSHERTSRLVELPRPAAASDSTTGCTQSDDTLTAPFSIAGEVGTGGMQGVPPHPLHHARLEQFSQAAEVFAELGFKPTPAALDRTVAQGQSLLQLLTDGVDGREMAEKLVRIVQRGADSRAELDAVLGKRRERPDVADMGTPSFDENA